MVLAAPQGAPWQPPNLLEWQCERIDKILQRSIDSGSGRARAQMETVNTYGDSNSLSRLPFWYQRRYAAWSAARRRRARGPAARHACNDSARPLQVQDLPGVARRSRGK